MKIELAYDKDMIGIEIPEANVEQVIRPWQQEVQKANSVLLREAFSGCEVEDFIRIAAGKRVCVLLDDGTRDEPFEEILPELFTRLTSTSEVIFLICTGTHNPDTQGNRKISDLIERNARHVGIESYAIHIHDCQHDAYRSVGTTSYGTEIQYNRILDEAEVFLAVSDVKVHYFAGYSNPVKNLVPGVCTFLTTEQNHSLALEENSTFGKHPWHEKAERRNNPLAADEVEGMHLLLQGRPVYALATISSERKLQWAGFGLIEPVSRAAFALVDERNTHTVNRVDRLVVAPGGFPNDTDLYIAQRALELTKNAIRDGGEILFLAACANGIGEPHTLENFYYRLTAPLDEVLTTVEDNYKLYSHKPYKFAQLIRRMRRLWVHTEIPDEQVEAAHLYPASNPQEVVDQWLAENPNVKITVVDGANKIALYAK
jgi:nickel-dependent lactate racemase